MGTMRRRDAEGFALIFAVWVLAILMVIVTAFAWNEMNEVKIAQLALDGIASRYLAEGGIERGIAEIKASYSADTSSRAWVSDNRGYGSTWAKLGSYTSDNNYTSGNLATTWGGASLRYYMPSQSSAYSGNDIGYFQVAVEDESGKVNLNSTNANKATMIDVGSYGLTAANATAILAEGRMRTVWDIARSSGINYGTAFYEKRFLTCYPNASSWLGISQDIGGTLNVNSAYYDGTAKGPLNAIYMSGGAIISAAQRNAIYAYRSTNPIGDETEFIAACGAAPATGAVRYDSAGFYRLISRGVTLASDGTTETGEAMIDAILKASFSPLDRNPVTIVGWAEWWEIY